MTLSRRDFVSFGLSGLGVLVIPRWTRAAFAPASTPDAHFFLQVIVPGGMDNSYLFDARPLAMTAANRIQNYLGEDPAIFSPSGGGRSLRTSLTQSLVDKFGDRFSVINGVLMSTSFDGHDQNTNFLFAGDPTGGESFIPHLNQGKLPSTQLDAIQAGDVFASLSNTGATVPLSASGAKGLITQLQKMPAVIPGDPLTNFIRQRFLANAQSGGALSGAARALIGGYDGVPSLIASLKAASLPDVGNTDSSAYDLDHFPLLMTELFRNQVCRSALLVYQPPSMGMNFVTFDTHDPTTAKSQPQMFKGLVDRLITLFQALKDTRYDDQRSFWDVTTVMVTSEFGRTLRQEGAPDIHSTGTDHNPLNNSVLIGGKGIKPGMVIGASDQVSADSAEVLSGAHLALDSRKIKIMGRPFDFGTMQPRTDLPKNYSAADYLQFASVANTLYSLFGVSDTRYRLIERNGVVAPVLKGLLS